MKIKEVSLRTGLTKKTIRFYEGQALFSSQKTVYNGREMHDYSQENVQALLNIAALRRARFTIDEIRRMQDVPENTPEIFRAYRDRLREETMDLQALLAVADTIAEQELSSAEDLILRMSPVAGELPLPRVDIHPRFRYLDELEAALALRKQHPNITEQECKQRKIATEGAMLYAAFSSSTSSSNQSVANGGYGSGFGISNAQKIAAYNLLLNSKDDS